MAARLLIVLAALLAGAGCSRGKATSGRPGASAASAAASSAAPAAPLPPLGRKHLASPTAFELAPSSDGATLVWAPAEKKDGAILAVDLDGAGRPKARARSVLPG